MTDLNALESLYFAALEKPPAERPAFLDAACGGNADLRAQVERMLAAQPNVGGFLEPRPADGATADAPAEGRTATFGSDAGSTADFAGMDEHVGAVLGGKYKLIEAIGEGGMGSVYLALQTEPVKRAVAVKVIKAGMDSKAVLARFEAERQALAMMDHPNIARVLDAGTTESGRPYFVMELVKGVPITQYCDERKLTPKQRLELFVPVCHAIQHAHQKGVIHRDIKPSNVLVALYDDRPVPKVIDFGVAKAAGQTLTDKTLMTGFGAVVGTPEYMSPEQANLNNLDIDTRSDVYSLGVLLYELLTGSTPVDRKSLGQAALLEILRIVREVEAPRPSAKLSTIDTLPRVAANRGTEPAKLSKLMKGELDWVLLKALEKDRTRRYDTANGLARDIQRYLADEVVEARPPSAGYRLRKFVKRHKGRVIAASLVVLVLLAGIAGTTWGLLEARRAAGVAETAREEETAQRRLASDSARRATDEAERAKMAEARTKTAFHGAVDWLLVEVLRVGGDERPIDGKEAQYLRELEAYFSELAERGGPETVDALVRLGTIRVRLRKVPEMEAAFEAAIALRRAAARAAPATAADQLRAVAKLYDQLAELHGYYWGEKAQALARENQIRTLHASARAWREAVAERPNDADDWLGLADVVNQLGLRQMQPGMISAATQADWSKALPFSREMVAALDRAVELRPADEALRVRQRNAHGALLNVIGKCADVTGWAPAFEAALVADLRAAAAFGDKSSGVSDAHLASPDVGPRMRLLSWAALPPYRIRKLTEDYSNTWEFTKEVVMNTDTVRAAWRRAVARAEGYAFDAAARVELCFLAAHVSRIQLPLGGTIPERAEKNRSVARGILAEALELARRPDFRLPRTIPSRDGKPTGEAGDGLTPEEEVQLRRLSWLTRQDTQNGSEPDLDALEAELVARPDWKPSAAFRLALAKFNWSSGAPSEKPSLDSLEQKRKRWAAADAHLAKLPPLDDSKPVEHALRTQLLICRSRYGELLAERKEYREAVRQFAACIDGWQADYEKRMTVREYEGRAGTLANAHYLRGNARLDSQEWEAAAADYRRMNELCEREHKRLEDKGKQESKGRSTYKFFTDYQHVGLFRLGLCLLRTGRGAEAETALDESIRNAEEHFKMLQGGSPSAEPPWQLAALRYDRGFQYAQVKRWGKAIEWCGRAVPMFEVFAKSNPAWTRERLHECHRLRAECYSKLEKWEPAVAAWALALPLAKPDQLAGVRYLCGADTARAGHHEAAAKLAGEMATEGAAAGSGVANYDAACVHSLCVSAAKGNAVLEQRYAKLAMATLAKAVAAGYTDTAHMKQDTDLAPLRPRADFKEFFADLERKFPPKLELAPPPREKK